MSSGRNYSQQEKQSCSSKQWKVWLTSNYREQEGKRVPVVDILKHAEREKDNFLLPLSRTTLGCMVKEIYTNVTVMQVRKGDSRCRVYRNLMKCEHVREGREGDLLTRAAKLASSRGWHALLESDSRLSLIKLQNMEFDGIRVTTEICVEEGIEEGRLRLSLKSLGRLVDPEKIFPASLSFGEKLHSLLALADSTPICEGADDDDNDDDDLSTYVLSTSKLRGTLRDTSQTGPTSYKKKIFSRDCDIFARSDQRKCCTKCSDLKRNVQKAKKRRLERDEPSPYCNNRWMDKRQLEQKLKEEKRRRENAQQREKYWQENFNKEALLVDDSDHNDYEALFLQVPKEDVPEGMSILWKQQEKILKTKSKKGYRWHPKVIRLCIELYCKNPHVLDSLRKFIYLPSNATIRNYKNRVSEKPGWNREVLQWLVDEAKVKCFKDEDYWGGFDIHEMKIQEDLELVVKNGKHKLVGFVELGETQESVAVLSGMDSSPHLATHVLQFSFLSDNGLRFPVAQYPSVDCTPSDLYSFFWEGVSRMHSVGFTIYWSILDGGERNRQFIKSQFKSSDDPATEGFTTRRPGSVMVFMVDCKHNIKKIRNNLQKSNLSYKPRCLVIDGKKTTWQLMKNAYAWDQESHSLPIHQKLTHRHFDLNPAEKMRKDLAEDVLDAKMLNLLQEYKKHLNRSGGDGSTIDGAIALVTQSARIIEMFSSKNNIADSSDSRLTDLRDVCTFFKDWCASASKKKHFISDKLWFDLQAMCIGAQSVVEIKLKEFPNSVLMPVIMNQDCVENHSRTAHGTQSDLVRLPSASRETPELLSVAPILDAIRDKLKKKNQET